VLCWCNTRGSGRASLALLLGFAKLSAEDRAKLALLEQEFERDGASAIKRFAENDLIAMLHIMECLNPKAVKDAIETPSSMKPYD
jgi:hypothetical protein